MMELIAPYLYKLPLVLAVCGLVASYAGKPAMARWILAASVAPLLGLTVHVTMLRGYPPLHGGFEGSLSTALVLSACILLFPVSNGRSSKANIYTFLALALLLVLLPMAFTGVAPRPEENMAALVWARLFFIFRSLSLGFLFFSSLVLLSGALAPGQTGANTARIQGRNVLLLGVCSFLASEVAGCYWCLLGWGDTWQWSGNFLRSTLFYLLIMLACHLPARWFSSYKPRALAMGLPPLAVFLIIFLMNLGY
ncbi:MAG: hypothetical protein ACNI3A_09835 [Desulfovibrio sp.]|uniref:hypothetical protein n=1 Tax=Desulfovibrio sp. 7SRBS1 TaxID=3378064 RepID=UPI003B413558